MRISAVKGLLWDMTYLDEAEPTMILSLAYHKRHESLDYGILFCDVVEEGECSGATVYCLKPEIVQNPEFEPERIYVASLDRHMIGQRESDSLPGSNRISSAYNVDSKL